MGQIKQLFKIKRFNKNQKLFEAVFFMVTIIAIIACLSPILRHSGLPQNHEGLAFVERTYIYADHFRQGDFVPIWSSSDAYGMGTPLPLFYHKTFYYVSGLLFIILQSIKLAIVSSMALFMLVGVYGMRFCVRKLGNRDKLVLLIVPQLLLFSNYTFSNWLVRGAMAEFSAMMLIPWLLLWCLILVKDKKFTLWIVPVMFLLVEAHNVTALFGTVLLFLALCIFLISTKGGVNLVWKRAVIAGGMLILLLVPQFALQAVFLKDYNPGKITQSGYLASENFRDPKLYFYDSKYVWLNNWQQLNTQIDLSISVLVAIAMLAIFTFIIFRVRKGIVSVKRFLDPSSLFFIGSLLVLIVLQLKIAKPVYQALPPLEFLQFPWRLLSYIAPLSILLIALALSKFKGGLYLRIFVIIWLGSFLVFSPISNHFKYDFFSSSFITGRHSIRSSGLEGDLLGIGEYLPNVHQDGHIFTSKETLELYTSYYSSGKQTSVINGSCQIYSLPRKEFEQKTIKFSVTCAGLATVALPVSYNRLSKIIDLESSKEIPSFRREDDPRLLINIPGAVNKQVIVVELPTISHIVKRLF
ncbi:hypothetical protein HY003_01180 [Candidatus Saccharibacteria bacterium]|nr:hypothetical protein [Candidatus Saccharibacteria bacterium]MBI3337890.1 hypothetical protein [Candidatus Saccharibacteria bacterium]